MRNNNTLLNRRLPAFAGIFVLLITLVTTVVLSRNTLLFVTKATVGSVPKELLVSNVTTNSFTISYKTDEPVIGTIAYGTQPDNASIALDDRDAQTTKPTEHIIHYVTIKNLQPATKYYYTIASGTQVISNNGTPFEVTTATSTTNAATNNGTVKGTAALDDGTYPTEGIVTITGENIQALTALLKPDGTYSIPLTQLRSTDLLEYIQLEPESKLELKIDTASLQSKAQIAAKQIDQVPKIVLSQNYDFTLSPDPLTPIASDSANIASESAGFPIAETLSPVTSPEITTPNTDQQFKDAQPLFKGRALPSTDITITINSQKEISAQLQSDTNGQWEFRPPIALDPGAHTITIESIDVTGTLQKLSRGFTVNAAGSQFIEPSGPPIEASPTIPPPITPTRAELPSPTPTPTLIATPTAQLSPTVSISPNQQGPIDPTGSSTILNSIIGIAAALGIGTLFFIITAI